MYTVAQSKVLSDPVALPRQKRTQVGRKSVARFFLFSLVFETNNNGVKKKSNNARNLMICKREMCQPKSQTRSYLVRKFGTGQQLSKVQAHLTPPRQRCQCLGQRLKCACTDIFTVCRGQNEQKQCADGGVVCGIRKERRGRREETLKTRL